MRFDADGILWVTGYSDGDLLRVDPDGFKSKVYPMPEFAPGFRPAPYALGVHPRHRGNLDQREHDRPDLSVHPIR